MHDIAEFLRGRDPFGELDEAELDRIAADAQVEFFAEGSAIPDGDDDLGDVVRVVRRGTVELLADGRVIDLLEEGELFGGPGESSGSDGGIRARAGEDTLTYALPAAEVAPLLAGGLGWAPTPAGIGAATAASLSRGPALVLAPETRLRDAALSMDERGTGVALICEGGALRGILTDRDLRSRVVSGELPADRPVTAAMSSPVISTTPDSGASEVLLLMLEHDVHHIPVLAEGSQPIGMIDALDLLAGDHRDPLVVRRAVSRARTRAELHEAAAALLPTVVAMHRAGTGAVRITETISVVTDALIRRAIELTALEAGPPPAEFSWLAFGSHGRREPVPSSDLDSGMVWRATPDGEQGPVGDYMRAMAAGVEACMREIGWSLDPHGVTASGAFSSSSLRDWEAALEGWLSGPPTERIALAIAIVMDARVVCGPSELDPREPVWERHRDLLQRSLLRSAIEISPPTGFLRDLVVEHGGEHRGTLDIKRGGLAPVVALARFTALETGTRETSTVARLRTAAATGTLPQDEVSALERAFALFSDLRITHQVEQLEKDSRPDDHLDPTSLDPLTRRYLRDAFREVAAIQRSLARKLELGRGRI